MASDQLNKMRVVGNRTRRATDAAEPQAATEGPHVKLGTEPQARSSVIPAIVFLIAAALGGAIVAYFRTSGVLA